MRRRALFRRATLRHSYRFFGSKSFSNPQFSGVLVDRQRCQHPRKPEYSFGENHEQDYCEPILRTFLGGFWPDHHREFDTVTTEQEGSEILGTEGEYDSRP